MTGPLTDQWSKIYQQKVKEYKATENGTNGVTKHFRDPSPLVEFLKREAEYARECHLFFERNEQAQPAAENTCPHCGGKQWE